MAEYFEPPPPFGAGQCLPEDEILELVELSLPKECQKELIIQGFESATQGLTELVDFCECLKTAEEIFQTKCEGNHQNKKTKQPGERHQSNKSAQIRGSYQATNPSEEDAKKKKTKNKNSPVRPLHGPGHDMNSCKVMLAQAKSMKSTWSTVHGGGTGHVRFQGTKKRPAKGEALNALVANAVKSVLKKN